MVTSQFTKETYSREQRLHACCMLSHFSHVRLFATLWTVAHQALLSMGFSRQEYWSGLLCPPPGDLPHPGIESASIKSNLHWQASSLPLAPPGEAQTPNDNTYTKPEDYVVDRLPNSNLVRTDYQEIQYQHLCRRKQRSSKASGDLTTGDPERANRFTRECCRPIQS